MRLTAGSACGRDSPSTRYAPHIQPPPPSLHIPCARTLPLLSPWPAPSPPTCCVQVRLWPAWKCVERVEGHSHPGTPTPPPLPYVLLPGKTSSRPSPISSRTAGSSSTTPCGGNRHRSRRARGRGRNQQGPPGAPRGPGPGPGPERGTMQGLYCTSKYISVTMYRLDYKIAVKKQSNTPREGSREVRGAGRRETSGRGSEGLRAAGCRLSRAAPPRRPPRVGYG